MSYEFAKKPDLPSRTNKPLKKTYSHAAKGLYGLSSFYPVTQRVKIEGNDVNFEDPNVQALIKCALLTKPIFLRGIMQGHYPERNEEEVADELIASVADELSNNPRECRNYDGVAQEVASAAKGRLDSERKEQERRSYKIGDTPMMFEESDRQAIEGDILFSTVFL